MTSDSDDNGFGQTLDEMDGIAFLNLRNWVRDAIEAKGAIVSGAGIGMGEADLDFSIDGAPFNLSVRPRKMFDESPLTGTEEACEEARHPNVHEFPFGEGTEK